MFNIKFVQREKKKKKYNVKIRWSVRLHEAFYFPKYDDATYASSMPYF